MKANYTIPTYAKISTTTVSGKSFKVWSDSIYRSTLAQDLETGEIKIIYGGGYIHKDVTVRKAIAVVFRLPTFKTEAPKTTTTKKEKTPEQKAKAAARRKARREAKKAAQAQA